MVLGALEVTYERLLNEESGIGISVLIPVDKNVNSDINYFVTPYYRFYFGNKYASGFFLEGFGMLNSLNDNITYYNGDYYIEDKTTYTDFALGIGLGGKWVSKRGLTGEINFGVGRNLFNSENNNTIFDIVGKFGITLGYRF